MSSVVLGSLSIYLHISELSAHGLLPCQNRLHLPACFAFFRSLADTVRDSVGAGSNWKRGQWSIVLQLKLRL